MQHSRDKEGEKSVRTIPPSEKKMDFIRAGMSADDQLVNIMHHIRKDWPEVVTDRNRSDRNELSVHD